MRREVIDLTRTHEPYWDSDNVLRYRRRQAHRDRYDLRLLGEALLFALALFAVIVATSGLEPRV